MQKQEITVKSRTMMSYCPDIKVVDCTMRDGGLVNNFGFTDEFVRDLYKANVAAGVDYMEIGYRASKNMFDPKEFGKWKFSDEEDIRAIVGENKTGLKLSIMADAGRCDYKTDILPKKDSVIDMVRVACYVHQIPLAIDMIEDAKAKGYEVTCNIMAVSKVSGGDLDAALKMVSASPADVLYLVDSFGNFYPENIAAMSKKYLEAMDGKDAGFHGHNNQQLAFANTIEACRRGVNYLDATVNGMGRGAGNCYTEMLLSFLKNPKYAERPILDMVAKHLLPMRAAGLRWGYDVPYLLTGILNSHPSSAIKFIKEGRTDYSRFLSELEEMI
ncbi:MAG: aldolase catalytic domain-containing protein [Kiritimatiellae bacterium]|nr:aldolase catalytic domain-containing protein [Kiritimatiellia bacterium]